MEIYEIRRAAENLGPPTSSVLVLSHTHTHTHTVSQRTPSEDNIVEFNSQVLFQK